jgi:hypothetical protein
MKLKIIYRTCEVIKSMHGTDRPFGMTKSKIIETCFSSLVNSAQKTDVKCEIIIVGDRLSKQRVDYYKPYTSNFVLGEFGNGKSLEKTFNVADELDEDSYIFFCEDDYLFTPNAINHMMDFMDNKGKYLPGFDHIDLFIHPPDYPDRYKFPDPFTRRSINSYFLCLSDYCHWRQVPSTTFTILCKHNSFMKFRDVFYKSAPTWNDHILSSEIYSKALCMSPLPGLASHMHDVAMTPLINWRDIINHIPTIQKSI